MSTTVNAIRCPHCQDIIFSRAHHDYHSCTCGSVTIDGGFEYTRIGYGDGVGPPKIFLLEVDATKHDLYDDWNYRKNKFGKISPGDPNWVAEE